MNKMEAVKRVYEFYYEELEFCGCGTPHNIIKVIKGLLNTVNNIYKSNEKYSRGNSVKYKQYKKISLGYMGECDEDKFDGVTDLIFNLLNNKGIMEHGGCVSNSWLTDEGEELHMALSILSDSDLENLDSLHDEYLSSLTRDDVISDSLVKVNRVNDASTLIRDANARSLVNSEIDKKFINQISKMQESINSNCGVHYDNFYNSMSDIQSKITDVKNNPYIGIKATINDSTGINPTLDVRNNSDALNAIIHGLMGDIFNKSQKEIDTRNKDAVTEYLTNNIPGATVETIDNKVIVKVPMKK